jgi:predicted enzyme related to lactoylglutathione lyase
MVSMCPHFEKRQSRSFGEPTTGAEIGIYIDDLDIFVKNLEKKGVHIANTIRTDPWAKSAQIEDPEKNLIYLMQLPEASINVIKKLRPQ